MTTREEMQARVEAALERYCREQMRPQRRDAWSRIGRNGVRLPMRKPARAKLLRVWGVDDARC